MSDTVERILFESQPRSEELQAKYGEYDAHGDHSDAGGHGDGSWEGPSHSDSWGDAGDW